MALAPTNPYIPVFFEETGNVTRERNFFPGSVEICTIGDVSAAQYTYTVAALSAREIRPYSLVTVAVTNGHFTVNAVLTIQNDYHQPGDVVEFVFTPADIAAGRTITIKDSAANTLATLSPTSDINRTASTRKFVLQSAGTWTQVGNVSRTLFGTATYDPASITAPNTTSTTITISGAAVGDFATATLTTLSTAAQITAYVSATDTVTVVVGAYSGTVNLASGTLNVKVEKTS